MENNQIYQSQMTDSGGEGGKLPNANCDPNYQMENNQTYQSQMTDSGGGGGGGEITKCKL